MVVVVVVTALFFSFFLFSLDLRNSVHRQRTRTHSHNSHTRTHNAFEGLDIYLFDYLSYRARHSPFLLFFHFASFFLSFFLSFFSFD